LRYSRLIMTVVVGLALGSATSIANAQGGWLDQTFGGDGWVTSDPGLGYGLANAVVVQPDGRIVAGGGAQGGWGLTRFNSDGSADTTFGASGLVETSFGGFDEEVQGLALQTDGKIVAVGPSSSTFAIARYNPDGSLDPSFSSNGRLVSDFGPEGATSARQVALQADGKIVVAGATWSGGFALARYNIDGSRDSTFGGDGVAITDLEGVDSATGIALQRDGRIIAAGTTHLAGDADFAVTRYEKDGDLDTTFGSSGKVTTDLGGVDEAVGVSVYKDGKIVVAGRSRTLEGRVTFAAARYKSTGALDNSFNLDGRVTTDAGRNLIVHAMSLQQDGKVLLVGSFAAGIPQRPVLIRYTRRGSLDPSFGDNGRQIFLSSESTWIEARAVTEQSDGKIIVAGGSGSLFLVMRLHSD
jgi:uncharacterized delta-60 repeat protein